MRRGLAVGCASRAVSLRQLLPAFRGVSRHGAGKDYCPGACGDFASARTRCQSFSFAADSQTISCRDRHARRAGLLRSHEQRAWLGRSPSTADGKRRPRLGAGMCGRTRRTRGKRAKRGCCRIARNKQAGWQMGGRSCAMRTQVHSAESPRASRACACRAVKSGPAVLQGAVSLGGAGCLANRIRQAARFDFKQPREPPQASCSHAWIHHRSSHASPTKRPPALPHPSSRAPCWLTQLTLLTLSPTRLRDAHA